MSSGSQTVGDAVVPKFDMHVYTSVLTSDEVKNLVAEYAIPLDLHPCVPPSGLTMNRLPNDKICIYDQYLELSGVRVPFSTFLLSGHWFSFERRSGKGGQSKIFNEFCTSLKHWKDRFFLIDRHAISDAMPWRHQDSSVADPTPTGVRAEDIHRLCEHIIDLRLIYPAMLYTIGPTTIWKHVGHHPVFKDGEGTGNIIVLQSFFPMAGGVRVGKGTALASNEAIPHHTTPPLPSGSQIPEKSDHQKFFEYENERVLAAKRKAQAAKDRAVRKRVAAEGASQRTKKKKTAPLSFALSDSEADESNRSGSGTHHSASPLNTIITNEAELTTGGDGLILEFVNRAKDKEYPLDNVEDTTEVNSPLSGHSPALNTLTLPMRMHITRGMRRLTHMLPAQPALQRSWFELGREALAQINILRRYEALNEDYRELYQSHRSCQGVFDRLTDTQNQLLDTVRSRNQLSEDHKALQQVHLGCVGKEADLTEKLVTVEKERDDLLDKDWEREERIRQLEADLASKASSLTETEGVVNTLKGDLDRLTVDLGQAEIVRHNYVRQLLPIVFQRLLSSGEYKKSLTDVFNLAIAAGCSKGVKVACFEEEAEAFLAIAVDYDHACKDTFMSAFDSLFDKSYPYVEKLAESFRIPLGDLRNMKRIFKKRSKKKAKNKQIQAREGKDQVKSKSKVIRMKILQLEGLKLPSLKFCIKAMLAIPHPSQVSSMAEIDSREAQMKLKAGICFRTYLTKEAQAASPKKGRLRL
ncbi:hypothetical protein Tco_0401971 [Tanacetum coccineum]